MRYAAAAAVVFVAALATVPFVRGTGHETWLAAVIVVAGLLLAGPFIQLLWLAALAASWWLAGFARPRGEFPCPVCGYDVRETPHRCPECGTRLVWGHLPSAKR